MLVDRFFLCLEEKPCLSMAGIAGVCQLGPCARVRLPPRADEEPTSSMERRGRRMGWRAGTTPLRHRGTSLSWQGWRTAPRKTDGDVATTEMRKAEAGEGDRRRKAGQSVY
jgi:hypothetical protein